ncbi:hypothetical protein Tco_0304803 [Tanacetum coccineum]
MVAKHDRNIAAEKEGKKKSISKADPSKKPATVKQLKPKPIKEKSNKPTLAPKPKRRTPATEEASTRPSVQPQDDASANIVRDSPSPADAKTGADTDKTNSGDDTEILQIGEEQEEDVDNQVGPDPGESHVALAGPNPEPMHDGFMANVYPNVHESLKFLADEHVILEDLLSSSETLSLMKNLDDAYTIGDQFLNDKSTEDEPGKLNVEAEVVSMVTVLISQASSSVPPLSTPVIDLSPPKHVPSTTQAPIVTTTTATTTTTLPLPPPPQQQSTTDPELAARLRDLPYKIDEAVREAVKEAVHVDLQAPLRDRFRELPEADMKEILHKRMFESGTYKSLSEYVALYEALEASMERTNRDEFLAEKDKSRKRRLDDQDPPSPPPKDSDQNKKKRHESDASRKAPSNSSKQKSIPYSKQPVEDVPMLDVTNISDSEDTYTAHLPKIKVRPEWLKPVPEEDGPASLEPDWTGNISSFVNWFCKRIGKKKRSKTDLEGPTFKVVQPFHDNNISLQFQMEKCHLLLTDQVDLVNPEGHRVVPDVSKPLPLGGDKGRRSALSISKLKAAQYLDFGLEELVPSLWIESEREYEIIFAYGISHWWFKRKEFYITRHNASFDRMYTFLKEIVLRRANYKEYKISEADFKNLHPNDFKDLYLLHLQGQLNLLSGADKVHLFNAIEENYTIVGKPKAVIYRDRNDQKKMMQETENLVDGRRSKEFMEVIERRLKIRRIFRSLESFVGGRLRDVDYRLIQRTK